MRSIVIIVTPKWTKFILYIHTLYTRSIKYVKIKENWTLRGKKQCSCGQTTGPRALVCKACGKPFSFKSNTTTATVHNTPVKAVVASTGSYGRAPISDGRGSIVVTPNAKPDVKFVPGENFHRDIIEWADRVRDAYNENLSNQALLYWLSSYFGIRVGTEQYEQAKAILCMEFPNFHVATIARKD